MKSHTHLWSCIKAHKAHAEVDCKSHEVALHDTGIRFTLQSMRTRCYPLRTRKPLLLSWKCHVSIINLCTEATELERRARLKSSQFSARCSSADLYPLHLQESGHLKRFFPGQQLALQFHTEEQVLPSLRLDAETVLPLVQKVVILR